MHASNKSATSLKALWSATDGQDLVEYSLLLGFISISAIALLSGWKSSVISIWTKAATDLSVS